MQQDMTTQQSKEKAMDGVMEISGTGLSAAMRNPVEDYPRYSISVVRQRPTFYKYNLVNQTKIDYLRGRGGTHVILNETEGDVWKNRAESRASSGSVRAVSRSNRSVIVDA
jgi:hypothetical protein